MKKKTSFSLSQEALDLLKRVSEEMGISQASAFELAIRDLARAREVLK